MNSTLCIIPARGGSKRLPRKNVRLLGGKPLLAYTVEAALESGVFDAVVVSSDDTEIREVALQYGADIDERPEALAGDQIRMVEVVEEYVSRPAVKGRFAHVAAMLPTCPFRNADDIRKAMQVYHAQDEGRFLITTTAYDFPPQLAMEYNVETHDLSMREPEVYAETTRSQNLKTFVHPNGGLYLGRIDRFLQTRSFFTPPLISIQMPAERSMDIDYAYQFLMAESFLESQLLAETQS